MAHAMDLREVLGIASQISDALSAAHEAAIVHRNVKPENVMVRCDGYVKVLDFGLAEYQTIRKKYSFDRQSIESRTWRRCLVRLSQS